MKLHRSITFWSGLLVLAFLAWAWRDSERSWTLVNSGDRHWARHGWGGVAIGSRGSPAGSPHYAPLFGASARPAFSRLPIGLVIPHKPEPFPPPIFLRLEDLPTTHFADFSQPVRASDLPPSPVSYTVHGQIVMTLRVTGGAGAWTLFVPHWLLMLATALLWAALLLWRARRRRKKRMTNAELPNAE